MTGTAADTIVAITTPRGRGGVGIVRISGPAVFAIARALTGDLPPPRQAVLRTFRAADGTVLDHGLVLRFAAPASYTGEDALELHSHGNPVILDALVAACCHAGARPAAPGEFTLRAFQNGQIDLAQAEAVADLIGAHSLAAARLASRTLEGAFSQRIARLVETLTRLRAHVEAAIDFPEDEPDLWADSGIAGRLAGLGAELDGIVAAARHGAALRDGLAVVIAGPPNAGKSSLLNALADRPAAIVTEVPGTTRDVLREDLLIHGMPVRVSDTAGLRTSGDPVEQEGIRRARHAAAQADLLLWVEDAAAPRVPPDVAPGIARVCIANKCDLRGEAAGVSSAGEPTLIRLSAKTGAGLDLLRDHLARVAGLTEHGEGEFMARRRHLEALSAAAAALVRARGLVEAAGVPELVGEELRAAQLALGTITGTVTPDDLLGRIFAEFCLGK